MTVYQSKWKREDLLISLNEFSEIYNKRPIQINNGGMKSPHMLSAWFIVKQLKPKYLIESGIWYGLGTWFFEQASPETKIISIDPNLDIRKYVSEKVSYQTTDFTQSDWSNIDKQNTLVFLDDHQHVFKRLKFCKEQGFKKIIFEDNYPPEQGDCLTPKKLISEKNFVIDRNGNKQWYKHNPEHVKFFKDNVSLYQEMPPIFKSPTTRWGDEWTDETYPTPEPLLQESDKEKYPLFYDEKLDYTWICYLELN